MTRVVRALTSVVAIGSFAASSVLAQGATFTTTGSFTGGGAGCSGGPTCTIPGAFTLQFTPSSGTNIGSGSNITLGSFFLTGTGTGTAPSALLFTLTVNQTSPTPGSASTQGAIAGNVSSSPSNFSSLFWAPTPDSFGIGDATYTLVFDNRGPGANVGYDISINDIKSLSALVVVTNSPEPASLALLATGLLGLAGGGAARRRRPRAIDA